MIVKENMSVYICAFCKKKKLFRKDAMDRHEERCYLNPDNFRPCLNCQHLEQKEIEFYTGIDEYYGAEPIYAKANTFFCKAKDILLLHPKTAYLRGRKNLDHVYLNDKETQQFEMPLQCDVFDSDKKKNEDFLENIFPSN